MLSDEELELAFLDALGRVGEDELAAVGTLLGASVPSHCTQDYDDRLSLRAREPAEKREL